VFNDKTKYPAYTKVEKLKNELLKNKELITVTDLGAGSSVDNSNERSISSIAKNASKSKRVGR